MQYYSIADIVLVPIYLGMIYFVTYFLKKKFLKKNHVYKFFLPGLFVKIFGALVLCIIYTIYYEGGGDTLNYHQTSSVLVNLLFESWGNFLKVWFGNQTSEDYLLFNNNTGYPLYWSDVYAFNVVKFTVPLEILALMSFPVTSILMAVLGFTGIWKLFLMFCELYPALYKQFAFSILFIPSVVFWGSGILKDTWTISAACWYCYSFYKIFISKKNIPLHVLFLIISIYVMISIKPYIFVALLPGSILWGIWGTIKKIKNVFLKVILAPAIILLGVGFGLGIWTMVSSELGVYSDIDKMLEKAQVSNLDLKRSFYQGNSFDIGYFDPTVGGVLSKFPEATIAGLFRPFIWETKNAVMIMSGLENLFILGFTLFFLIRVPVSFFKQIIENPLVMFCVLFSVIFAFSVGLSTSNFGALVRFKIPLWPFYLSAMFIINHHRIKYKMTKISQDTF